MRWNVFVALVAFGACALEFPRSFVDGSDDPQAHRR